MAQAISQDTTNSCTAWCAWLSLVSFFLTFFAYAWKQVETLALGFNTDSGQNWLITGGRVETLESEFQIPRPDKSDWWMGCFEAAVKHVDSPLRAPLTLTLRIHNSRLRIFVAQEQRREHLRHQIIWMFLLDCLVALYVLNQTNIVCLPKVASASV